jgi:hypothetical protein
MASGRATICSMDLSTVLSRSRPQQSQPAKPAPRNRSSPDPHAGQTMRPGPDVSRDGTFTLASFAARRLLLIEPTILLRRNGSVTVSVTEGEIRQRESPRARTRGVRISYGGVIAPSYSRRLRSLDPAQPGCAAPNQVTSARRSPDWASPSGSSDAVTQAT